jgi:hypothetical protein
VIIRASAEDIEVPGISANDQDFTASARALLPILVDAVRRVRVGEPSSLSAEALAGVLAVCETLSPEPWAMHVTRTSNDTEPHLILAIPTKPMMAVYGASASDLEFIVVARGAIPRLARYLLERGSGSGDEL